MATEADTSDPMPLLKREAVDTELMSELSRRTTGEVPAEEENKVESWLNESPETIKILEKTEDTQLENGTEVAAVTAVNKGNVSAEGENFMHLPSVVDGKSKDNTEESQMHTKDELQGSQDEGKEGMIRNKNITMEAHSDHNEGVMIQTANILAEASSMDIGELREVKIEENMNNGSGIKTPFPEQDSEETSFKGEDQKSNMSSILVVVGIDPETIQPHEDGAEDTSISKETISPASQQTEVTKENDETEMDKHGSSLVAALTEESTAKGVLNDSRNLGEKDRKDVEGSREITELRKTITDVNSTESDIPNKDFESSFVKKVDDICLQKENLGIFKEESETGLKVTIKESQSEMNDQNEILENINRADSSSRESNVHQNPEPTGDILFQEPEGSMRRESKNITPTEVMMVEGKYEGVAEAGEENIVAQQQNKNKFHQEEQSQQSFIHTNEPAKVNLESPLDVARQEIETIALSINSEMIAIIDEQKPVGSPQNILGETRRNDTISDGISKEEIPEEEDLSSKDIDKKTTSTEVFISTNNGNDSNVNHPPMEETAQVGGEKHDIVSISELGDQEHEAYEAHQKKEKQVNEIYEASKSPESTVSEHRSAEGAVSVEAASIKTEIDVDELQKGNELNSEEELKDIDTAYDTIGETEEKEDTAGKEFQIERQDTNGMKATLHVLIETQGKFTGLETSGEGEDNEECTEEEFPVTKANTLCTKEADHHSQEDKSRPNSHEEPAYETDSGDQSSADQIINKEVIQNYEGSKTAEKSENVEKNMTSEESTNCSQEYETEAKQGKTNNSTEMGERLETTIEDASNGKQVLIGENKDQELSMASSGEELDTESPKEEAIITEMTQKEVLAAVQTLDRSAKVRLPANEEDGISKENIADCDGEETQNQSCYEEEKGGKEPETAERLVLETNHGGRDTAEKIEKNSLGVQPAECLEERAAQDSSQEENAQESKTIEESDITDLPSLSVTESQTEEDNQNEFLEQINTADSTLSKMGEAEVNHEPKADISYREPEKSTRGKGKDIALTEASTMECKLKEISNVAAENDFLAEKDDQTETFQHEETSEKSIKQKNESSKQNLESLLNVASEHTETTTQNEYADMVTIIEEPRPAEEQDQTETLKHEENSEKSFMQKKEPSKEKLESPLNVASEHIETTTPNEYADMVTIIEEPRPAEEQDQTETLKHEENSEKSFMQKKEPSKENLESSLNVASEHIGTTAHNEYADMVTITEEPRSAESPVDILKETTKDETIISYDINKKEIQEERNLSTNELCEKTRNVEAETPSSDQDGINVIETTTEETVQVGDQEQDEASTSESRAQVHEAFEVQAEEEKHANETYEGTDSPENTITEQTPTEGGVSIEVASTKSEMDIGILEKGHQLKSEEELKVNTCNKEVTDQKEKAADDEFEMARIDAGDDDEKCTTEEEIPVNNSTPLYTQQEVDSDGEEHKRRPNISEGAASESNSGDQSCRTSETKDSNDQMINEQNYGDSKIADSSEDTEKEIKIENFITSDHPPGPIGKDATDCSQENDPEAKKFEPEALEVCETYKTSAAIEETAITHLHASSGDEKEDDKSLKEDKKDAMRSEKEVEGNLVSEDKDPVTTESSENGSTATCITAKSAETSNLGENKDVEILTAQKHGADEAVEMTEPEGKNQIHDTSRTAEDQREMATADTFSDDLPEQNLQVPTLPLEEHNTMIAELDDEISETPEDFGCIDTVQKSGKDDARDENQESYKHPQPINERTIAGSDVEVLKRVVNTSKSENSSEITKVETSEDEKSIDRGDKFMSKVEVDEPTKGVEGSEIIVPKEATSLGEVQLNDELVEDLGASSDTENLRTAKAVDSIEHDAEAERMKLEDTSSMVSHLAIKEGEKTDDESTMVENALPQSKDQSVKESHDNNEIARQIKEVPESFSKPIGLRVEANRDNESAPVQTLRAKDAIRTADGGQDSEVDSMKFSETSDVLSQSLMHEHQKANSEDITTARSDANDFEETIIPESESRSNDKSVEEIHETCTSLTVEDTATDDIKTQNREISEVLSEPINQGTEAATDGEIVAPDVMKEITCLEEVQLNDEPLKGLHATSDTGNQDTSKAAGSSQQDPEVDSMKLKETSIIASDLPIKEDEKAENESTAAEKSNATHVEIEEIKIPDAVHGSKDQPVKEIHVTCASLTVAKNDANEIVRQIREAPESPLSEPIEQQNLEAARDDETAPCQTLGAEDNTEVANGGKYPEVDSMKLSETSNVVPQSPTAEHQKANNENITTERSDLSDVEVEAATILEAESTNDKHVEEIHETVTSLTVGDTETNHIKTQTREVSEELSKPINQGVEIAADNEIVAPEVVKEITSSGGVQLNDEPLKDLDANSDSQQDAQVDSIKLEETSTMVSHLSMKEDDTAENDGIVAEKSNAPDVEEIHETGTSLTVGELDVDQIDKQIIEDPESLSEAIDQSVEAPTDDKIASGQTSQAEEVQEQYQKCSALIPNQDCESTVITENTEDRSTKKDDRDVSNLSLEETPGLESPRREKSDLDIKFEESETLDAASEVKNKGFEEIHDTACPTAENIKTDEMPEDVKEVNVRISDVQVVGGSENPDQSLPTGKLQEQLQVSSSADCASIITEKIKDVSKETGVDKVKLEEATTMLPIFPKIEHENGPNRSETTEKSDSQEIEVEEPKLSEAIYESKIDGGEELYEIAPSLPLEKTTAGELEEEIEAVPALIKEHDGTIINLEMIKQESTKKEGTQLMERVVDSFEKSTTKNTHLQDEGAGELQVSNLDLTVEEGAQNIAPEEENTATEEASTDEPQEYIPETKDATSPTDYEKRPTQCSSEDTSKDDDGMDSGNSNSASNYLPHPHPTERELLGGEMGEKCKEVASFKLEETREVPESGSKIQSSEISLISKETEMKESLKRYTNALRDGENHSGEAAEGDEAIKQHSSDEIIADENQVSKASRPPHEGTVLKGNEEDELAAESPRERTIETTRNEIQHEEDEGPRELQVSHLDLTVEKGTQKIATVEENTNFKESSIVEPQEYTPQMKYAQSPTECERMHIQCSSQDTSKDEGMKNLEISNNVYDYLSPTAKELLPGEIIGKGEEASSLKYEKTEEVLEYESQIHSPEVPLVSNQAEIKKETLDGAINALRDGQNNYSERTTKEVEATNQDASKKMIAEENQVAKISHLVPPCEETVTNSNEEDDVRAEKPKERTTKTTRNEVQHEELLEGSEQTGPDSADKSTTETIIAEVRTAKDPNQELDEAAKISLSKEAKDRKMVDEAPTKVDLENQADATNFRDTETVTATLVKEIESSEVMLEKHEEEITAKMSEEALMTKHEKLQTTDLAALPVTNASTEKAPGEKFKEHSGPDSKGPTHGLGQAFEDNKDTATADTNSSEYMGNEKTMHKSLEPACEENGVSEVLDLKRHEVCAQKPAPSQVINTETETDLTSDTQEVVSILEVGESIQPGEHMKDEKPEEFSTMGNERKLNDAKVQTMITANEDEETQNQQNNSNLLFHAKDTEASNKETKMNIAKVTEITNNKQEADLRESTDTSNSTASSKDVPLMQDKPIATTFKGAEVEYRKDGNASGTEPAGFVKFEEEKRTGEEYQETTAKSETADSTDISLSDLLQISTKETSPMVESLTGGRELTSNKKKEAAPVDTAETAHEEAKTDEEKDEDKEGDEHKEADSSFDAPIMVEASQDVDVKIAHKKSHNILSGVGSKVKHSIAKVKKAITGKPSHPKTTSPK